MTSDALTADQQDEFRTTGLLRLEGGFPRAAAEAMGDRLWEFLASRVRASPAAHPWLRGLWEPGHGGDRE